MHPRQIENRRDTSHEVIVRDDIIETEFIEQLALITLQPPHHRKTPAAQRGAETEPVFEVEGKCLLQQNRHRAAYFYALQQFRQLSEGIAEVPGNRVSPLWRGGVPNRQARPYL